MTAKSPERRWPSTCSCAPVAAKRTYAAPPASDTSVAAPSPTLASVSTASPVVFTWRASVPENVTPGTSMATVPESEPATLPPVATIRSPEPFVSETTCREPATKAKRTLDAEATTMSPPSWSSAERNERSAASVGPPATGVTVTFVASTRT